MILDSVQYEKCMFVFEHFIISKVHLEHIGAML